MNIYILSTPDYIKINRFKIGKHTGYKEKLIDRYKTALPDVNIIYFKETIHTMEVEKIIKMIFYKHRVKMGLNDTKSEWIIFDIKKLIEIIEYQINIITLINTTCTNNESVISENGVKRDINENILVIPNNQNEEKNSNNESKLVISNNTNEDNKDNNEPTQIKSREQNLVKECTEIQFINEIVKEYTENNTNKNNEISKKEYRKNRFIPTKEMYQKYTKWCLEDKERWCMGDENQKYLKKYKFFSSLCYPTFKKNGTWCYDIENIKNKLMK